VLTIRRSKLYYTASGISIPVGGRPVHRLREDSYVTATHLPPDLLLCSLTCMPNHWPKSQTCPPIYQGPTQYISTLYPHQFSALLSTPSPILIPSHTAVILGLLDSEYDGTLILKNVSNYLQINMM